MNDFLKKLKKNGELTPFLYQKLCDKINGLSDDMQRDLINEAKYMSKIGVSSNDDHKTFFYIFAHINSIIRDIAATDLSDKEITKVSSLVFNNKDKYPIDTIFNFYKAVSNALKVFNISIRKTAYPQGDQFMNVDSPYSVEKWMQSMREIYAEVHRGYNFSEAFKKITANWDFMEKQRFDQWMRFYQEGAHNKYKTAQNNMYYTDDDGISLVPINALQSLRGNIPGMPDMNQFEQDEDEEKLKEQKRKNEQEEKDAQANFAKQLRSRLNAAERLATDDGAYDILGGPEGVERFLSSLHALKRMMIKSKASFLYKDLIIRQGNILINNGCDKAGKYIISLAQEEPKVSELSSKTNPEEDVEKLRAAVAPAEKPSADTVALPDTLPEKDIKSGEEALNEFIEGVDADDCSDIDKLAAITVTSQPILPPMESKKPDYSKKTDPILDVPADIEVSEDDEFDLSSINTEDIIKKLELVSNILKNREIPRQLSMIDLMMDKLGIAAFFPTLGEATRSALESNQYMSTRIDDILSKLQGSIEPPEDEQIELAPEEKSPVEAVKENLELKEDKEEKLKEIRKQRREEKDMGTESRPSPITTTPEQELAGPVEIERRPAPRAPTPPARPVI